jgi:hypothetical protein
MFKMEVRVDEQLMTVPYALNKTFREIFKTAKFRRGANVFVAKATPQNKTKWTKFADLAQTATDSLARCDEMEVTAQELENATRQMEADLVAIQREIIDKTRRIKDADARRLRAAAQIADCKPALEDGLAEFEEILLEAKHAEIERDAVIAPAIALFELHEIDKILDKYVRGVQRGYRGKDLCREAKQETQALWEDLQRVGYRHIQIYELYTETLNRPDKILLAVDAVRRNLHSGIYFFE